MFAKSVHDRLQRSLHFAGPGARPLRGTFAVLAVLVIASASVLLYMDEQMLRSEATASSHSGTPPVTVQSQPAVRTPLHAEETRYQALAEFLAKKYRVSERVIFNLVSMAHTAGRQIGIDPLLIIAVMAVESRFNPIAESIAGAKGLMQVIPKYHEDKLKGYGGEDSVFDPQTNILVGSQILKEYIARTGSIDSALQMYAGALDDVETIYTSKVMSEKQRLQQVVSRRSAARVTAPKRPAREPASDATPI